MGAVGKSKLTKDEMIMELMELLKQNNMQKEANDTFEICAYVDSLEKKLDAMTEELANVQKQLTAMKEDTFFNHIRNSLQEAKDHLQGQCDTMKQRLFEVKEGIKDKAQEIVTVAKKKRKAALNKVAEIFHVKEKLISIRENVKESQKVTGQIIAKIDAFGTGMREAGQKIANTFRTFADKPEVDYSEKEKKFSKTELVKRPWQAKQKLLAEMELRLDAAIDKVGNLERNAEIGQDDKDKETHNKEKHIDEIPHTSMPIVAEPAEYQYGADAFEAAMNTNKVAEQEVNVAKIPCAKKGR